MSRKNEMLRQLFPEGGKVRELASQDVRWCVAATMWIKMGSREHMASLKVETERVRAQFALGRLPVVGMPGSRGKRRAKEESRWFAALKGRLADGGGQ